MIKTWLKGENHGQLLFVWVFSTLQQPSAISKCLCLLLLRRVTQAANANTLTECCWGWSVSPSLWRRTKTQARFLGSRRTGSLHSLVRSLTAILWRVKKLSYVYSGIIVALLLHVQLNPWPSQCHWFEMHVYPLGTVAGVPCYSQSSSKEKDILFCHHFQRKWNNFAVLLSAMKTRVIRRFSKMIFL